MKNVFIISGPAGSGKDAVIDALEKQLPLARVVTSTTRARRPDESEGRPYHFLSRSEFEAKIARNEFLEYSVNENAEYYGVTREEIERLGTLDNLVLWKVDWKGVESVKKIYPNIKAILVTAPLAILEARLRKRDGTNHPEAYFEERMAYAREWMKHLQLYDYTIENEEGRLEATIAKVRAILEDPAR